MLLVCLLAQEWENAEVVASQRLVKMVDLVAFGYHTGLDGSCKVKCC